MHKQVAMFIGKVKLGHPEFFSHARVLDCGSLDINGSNWQHFVDSVYTGIDIVDGRNVDYVTCVHEFQPKVLCDVVISTEMLEHDECYTKSLLQMFCLLRPCGMPIITAAAFGRKEPGTTHHSPQG
jgi:hypothetical protein